MLLRRFFHQAMLRRTSCRSISFSELRVPVPHGHIAAKVWGSPDSAARAGPSCRVLAVHGWQDNANSFDPLIKHPGQGLHTLLTPNSQSNESTCIVALDFTGHGLSSHLPKGSIYTHHQYALDIAAVANYLQWEKFSLICHSMGTGVGFYYSLMFPERVAKLAGIDGTFPFWNPPVLYGMISESAYRSQEKFNYDFVQNKIRPPKKWIMTEYLAAIKAHDEQIYPDSPDGSASHQSIALLLERGSSPATEGGFTLNRDPNVRHFFTELSGSSQLCLFLDRFDGSGFRMLVWRPDKGLRIFQDTYDILDREASKHMASYESISVQDATHHVHMNEPEKILPKLVDFLLKP